MNRLIIAASLCFPLLAASACLNLTTTESTSSSSSGAAGRGGEGGASSSSVAMSSSSSGAGNSGAGGAGGAAGSPLPGWAHRRALAIASQPTPLTNYMLMVSVAQDPAFGMDAQPDGDDLVFTDSDGVTILPHEFEYYKVVGGMAQFVAWVRLPQLPEKGKTIYVYYGNSLVGSQQDNDLAWQDYAAVYHLHSNFNDSTRNGHNGSILTPSGPPPVPGPAVIGNGHDFEGGSVAEIADSPDFNCVTKDCTISVWLSSTGSSSHAVDHYLSSGTTTGWYIGTTNTSATFIYGGLASVQMAGPMSAGQWHHVAVVKASGVASIYIDGVERDSISNLGFIVEAQAPLYIGSGSTISNFYTGSIDEVRIAPTTRSVSWLRAEIDNALKPNEFVSIGSPESF